MQPRPSTVHAPKRHASLACCALLAGVLALGCVVPPPPAPELPAIATSARAPAGHVLVGAPNARGAPPEFVHLPAQSVPFGLERRFVRIGTGGVVVTPSLRTDTRRLQRSRQRRAQFLRARKR